MITASKSHSPTYYLPEEIWIEIFGYLRPIDIIRARLVCKHWAFLSTLPRIKKNLSLRLDQKHSPLELKTYIAENNRNYLPIHRLNVINLDDDKDLEFILKEFSQNLKCIQLKNSNIFKTIAAANLYNIEEFCFKFYGISPERFDNLELQFFKSYKHLKSLNIICPDEIITLGINILQQLLESNITFPLQHLHLTYHFDNNDTFLKILRKYAPTLKELEVYFDVQPYPWCPKSWQEILSKLINLEILKVSGDCRIHITKAFFENLPENAPLRYIDLDGITTLTDDILRHITDKWMYSINHLSIFFSGRISKKGAAEIWKLRKNLKTLKIGYCRTIGMGEILTAVASATNYNLRQLCTYSMGKENVECLCKLAKNLPNLEVLDLSDNAQDLTNGVLAHIFRYQIRLRELILDACFGFDDNGIAGYGVSEWSTNYSITRLQNLEVLSLQYCRGLRKKFIDYLVFPALRCLKLSKLRYVNAEGFCKIVDNCPKLEVLHVAYCDGFNDEALYYICDNLKLLIELNIEHCSKLSTQAIDYALNNSHIRLVEFTNNNSSNS